MVARQAVPSTLGPSGAKTMERKLAPNVSMANPLRNLTVPDE